MRGLRITAIVSASLALVLALFVGYLFHTAQVRVTAVTAKGVSASTEPTTFENLKQAVEEDTFTGTMFHKPTEWRDMEDYVLMDYTLQVQNDCLVSIDMLQVQVSPLSEDVLQVGDFAVHSLDMKSSGEVTVRILTTKEAHPVRDLILTYYVWGVGLTTRATYGSDS